MVGTDISNVHVVGFGMVCLGQRPLASRSVYAIGIGGEVPDLWGYPRTSGMVVRIIDRVLMLLFPSDTESEKQLVQGGVSQSPDSEEFAGSIPIRVGIDCFGKGADFIHIEDGPSLKIL